MLGSYEGGKERQQGVMEDGEREIGSDGKSKKRGKLRGMKRGRIGIGSWREKMKKERELSGIQGGEGGRICTLGL